MIQAVLSMLCVIYRRVPLWNHEMWGSIHDGSIMNPFHPLYARAEFLVHGLMTFFSTTSGQDFHVLRG